MSKPNLQRIRKKHNRRNDIMRRQNADIQMPKSKKFRFKKDRLEQITKISDDVTRKLEKKTLWQRFIQWIRKVRD